MKTLFSLFFIFISSANAECIPKDLTDPTYLTAMGKEKLIEHFKVPQDQDSVGWCGAYSSGDALSFAAGEPVSAIDISMQYYADTFNNNGKKLDQLRGIDVLAATNIAKKFGYCPVSVIPSNQTSSSNLGQSAILQLMRSFQEIYDDYVSKGRPDDFCVDCIHNYENVIKPSLPAATTDIINNVLRKNQSNSATAFADLLDQLCEGKRVKVNPKTQLISKNQLRNKTFADEIDKALDNDSMPSIVIHTSFFASPQAVPGGGGEHGMLITGKRADKNGKCEYLVRNSWGRGCSYYQPQIKAKCDPANGTFWMDQNEVQTGISHIVVIKNEKIQSGAQIGESISNAGSKLGTFFDRFKTKSSNGSAPSDNSQLTPDSSNTKKSKVTKETITKNADAFKSRTLEVAGKIKTNFSSLMKSIWKTFSDAFKY